MIEDDDTNSLPAALQTQISYQDDNKAPRYKQSGFVISKLGISLKTIPNFCNLSLIYSISNSKCLLHSKNFQPLSKKIPQLIRIKQCKKLIYAAKSELEFIQTLSFIKKGLQEVNYKVDVLINAYNTNNHEAPSKLMNGCSTGIGYNFKCISELLDQCCDSFENLLHNSSQYNNELLKRSMVSSCTHHVCSMIISMCNTIAKKLIQVRNMMEFSGTYEFLPNIIYRCHVLKTDISKFYNSMLSLSSVQTPKEFKRKLKRCLDFVMPFVVGNVVDNKDGDAVATLMWYIAESAKARSKVIVRLIVDASSPLTNLLHIENKSNCDAEVVSPSCLEKTEYKKKVCKEVTRKFKKIVSTEMNLFKSFLQDVLRVNTCLMSQNSRKLYNHATHSQNPYHFFKIIHWETSMGPVQKEYIFDHYMKILWLLVKHHIAGVYILICIDSTTSNSLSGLTDKRIKKRECMSNCVGRIDAGGHLPNQLLEVLSLFAYSVDAIHRLQQWDKGMCQAMSTFLKDRFRLNDTSKTGSSTINCMLSNHARLMELITVLKNKDGLIKETNMFHAVSIQNCILQPLISSFNFLNFCLIVKRQQFLASAAWEPFFIIITVDLKEIYEQVVNDLNLIAYVENQDGEPMLEYFDNIIEDWKMFKTSSVRGMVQVIKTRSRDIWKQHMPDRKMWRRRGSHVQVYKGSSYTIVALQSILAPIVDSLECVSRDFGLVILCKCFAAFVKSWMDHILTQQIVFSRYGANQLSFDFMKFLQWFEEDAFDFTNEEISEIQSLSVINEMKNVIMLLSCQPEPRKPNRDRSMLNSTVTFGASSASAISQVSLDSLYEGNFDTVLQSIDIRDKERWLSLRAKGGQTKKQFLCIG